MQYNKILWKKISTILFCDWDPIGINNEPDCEDEYNDYVGKIYCLIQSEADVADIAKYLIHIETQYIGLNSPDMKERSHRIAKQLHALQH